MNMGLGVKTFITNLPAQFVGLGDSLKFWGARRQSYLNWRTLAVLEQFPYLAPFTRAGGVATTLRHRNRVVRIRRASGIDFFITPQNARLLPTITEVLEELKLNVKNTVCIDIGAHVGGFAVALAERGAQVLAFEPDPENYGILVCNAAMAPSGSIQTFEKAVGGRSGKLEFFIGPSSTSGALKEAATTIIPRTEKRLVTVAAASLQEIFDSNQIERCALAKIDIEGAEYDALFNLAPEYLARIENILMEIHPADGQTPDRLIEYLKKHGFKAKILNRGATGCMDVYFSRSNGLHGD